MSQRLAYVDTSAFVKLVLREPQTAALRRFLRGHILVSSALLRAEARRAIRGADPDAIPRMSILLTRVSLIPVDDQVLDRAGSLEPLALRTLDAIHVATALDLAADVDYVVTYDRRMHAEAVAHGLEVAAPGESAR